MKPVSYSEIILSDKDIERFLAAPLDLTPHGCWVWLGWRTHGYGGFKTRSRAQYRAHRVALCIAGRPPRIDQVVDHLCRNKLCVNPDHLEATTVAVNTARGIGPTSSAVQAALQGRCVNGHVIGAVGTHSAGTHGRTCAECGRERASRYRARKAAAASGCAA